MLQFLQAWLWVFAAAAALPVILHLLSRQRLRKIQFSSLMLLSRLEKSQMKRLRLRQLLLLILRTLAIVALVFAFTRPLIRSHDAPLLGEETAAALVVDRSASMSAMDSGGRRSDRARAAARKTIEALRAGDRLVAVADTGGAAVGQFRHERADWEDLVDSLRPGSGRADLGAAVDLGLSILDTVKAGSKELYVITDGQRSAWRTLPVNRAGNVRLFVASVGSDLQPNRSVRTLDFGGSLWIAHAPLEVQATIANDGPEVRDLPVSLFFDGSRVAQRSATIARGDSTVVTLVVSDVAPGWHHGRVEITADAWPADNQMYFALEAAENLPVLVLGDNQDLRRMVQVALRPGQSSRTPFLPEVLPQTTFATEVDPRFGLVVLAGTRSLPPQAWERLLRFVRGGGGLWVLLDPVCDDANYNRHLIEPVFGTSLLREDENTGDAGFVTLETPPRHPLFSFLERGAQFPDVRFRGTARLAPVRAELVRQRFSSGQPAVLDGALGNGRIVLFAGYAGPDESDLVYHPIFVPIVQSAATYVARRGALGSAPYYAVGQHPPGLARAEGRWRWITPSGDTLVLPGGPLRLPRLDLAGIYTLLQDNTRAAYVAANLSRPELDFETVDDYADVLGGRDYRQLDLDESFTEQISEARVGIDLWYPAIVLVLILLLAEMAVAWPRPSEIDQDSQSK